MTSGPTPAPAIFFFFSASADRSTIADDIWVQLRSATSVTASAAHIVAASRFFPNTDGNTVTGDIAVCYALPHAAEQI